ncbi:hypothetical protein BD408DRAFT_413621 [Parasitella parasitica]|nr:hypothetical protein BD408DRAFT_413621 [Parasitella parasitica]
MINNTIMMKNIKVEAVDQTVSTLVKGEPCGKNVSLASPSLGSARQAITESEGSVVKIQAGSMCKSSSVQQIIPSKSLVDVNKQAGSLNSVESTQKGSNHADGVRPVAKDMQAALHCKPAVNNQPIDTDMITVNPDAADVRDGDCSNRPINVALGQKCDNNNVENMDDSTVVAAPAGELSSSKETSSVPSNPPANKRVAPSADVRLEEAYDRSNKEKLNAMQSILQPLEAKIVRLTLQLVVNPDRADLSQALDATEKRINLVKRSIKCLQDDVPVASIVDENYEKLSLILKLIPYFQWEGNITNKNEKVFLTIYACLRQVERAVKECDFDIESKWVSLISTKLSSKMYHWLDNLLLRNPNCSWSLFKTCLIHEYEMPQDQAVQTMSSCIFNKETETMNAFVSRFLMAFEYSKSPDELGEMYFQTCLPTMADQRNFMLLCQSVKKNHTNEKLNLYRAIELYRDIYNQTHLCSTFKKQESCSTRETEIKTEKKAKKHNKPAPYTKARLRCIHHPKANSHTTENCRNLQV